MAVELDVANLVLAVDSTGVVKANTALDDLAVKGELVGKSWESSAQRAGSAGRQLGQAVEQTTTDMQRRIDALVNGKSKSWVTDILAVDPKRASTITGTYAILFKQIEDQEKAHAAKMLELQKAEQEAMAVQAAQAAARSREQRLTIAPGAPAFIGAPSSSAGPMYGAMTQAEAEAAAAKNAAFKAQTELNTAMRDYSALMQGVIISQEHMAQVQNSLNLLLKEGKIAQVEYNAAQAAFSKAQFLVVPPGGAKAVSDLKGELKEAEVAAVGFAGGMNKARVAAELSTVSTELAGGNIAQLRRSIAALVNQTGLLRAAMSLTGLSILAPIAALVAVQALEAKGETIQREYNNSLALTDHYAALSMASIHLLAESVSGANVTVGTATETFIKLAETGKYTADQVKLIGTTALEVAARTGQSADSILKIFDEISDGPSKALLKYDQFYHFLTNDSLQRIEELEREGQKQEAVYEAQQLFSQTAISRLQNETDNVGYLTQAWRGLKGIISDTATAIEQWGMKQEHADKAQEYSATANSMLEAYQNRKAGKLAGIFQYAQYSDEELLKQVNHYNDLATAEGRLAQQEQDARDKQAKADQEHTQALATADDYAKRGLSLQEAITAENIKYNNTLKNMGGASPERLAEIQRGHQLALLDIQNRYSRQDHGLGRAENRADVSSLDPDLANLYGNYTQALKNNEDALKQYQESSDAFYTNQNQIIADWARNSVADILKQEDAIRANMGTGKQYYQSEAQLNQLETKRIDILNKAAIAFDDSSRIKIKAMQAEEQASLKYEASLMKELAAIQHENSVRAASVGMGSMVKQYYDEIDRVVQDSTAKQIALEEMYKQTNNKLYADKFTLEKQYEQKKIAAIRQGYKDEEAADASYYNGFKQALQNIEQEYSNVAKQTDSLVENDLATFNQNLISAMDGNTIHWKAFLNSVLDGIVEMELKAEEAQLLKKLFPNMDGSSDLDSATTKLLGAGAQWQAIVLQIDAAAAALSAAATEALAAGGVGGASGGGYTGGDGGGGTWGTIASIASNYFANSYSAKGNAFDSMGLVAMRRGGYMVTSPTLRTMANGGTAMIGEAHPEGVFPLTRDNAGNLGIAAVGNRSNSGGTQVVIKDYSGGQKPEVHESTNADGQKLIEIVLGKAEDRIAQSVSNGKVGKAIQGRFGISKQGQRY